MKRDGWFLGLLTLVAGSASVLPVQAGQTHTVELVGITFIPPDITIEIGDTVRWAWISGFHNVESGVISGAVGIHDGNFRSGDPTGVANTTFELLFDTVLLEANPMPSNFYPFFCVVHAGLGMAGSISIIRHGDVDQDGLVNLADYQILAACLAGPDDTAAPLGCFAEEFDGADLNDDGKVDLSDFAELQLAIAE